MPQTGRAVKITARPGQGSIVAQELLEIADGLADVRGCLLYLINRSATDSDVVWVLERWESQADLDAALAHPAVTDRIRQVRLLVTEGGFERFDLEPLGGHTAAAPGPSQGSGA